MPWQQHWLWSTVAACFPCGQGVFCSRFWSTAVFNDKKLEHILSFRQNIAVIIKTLLFCYVKQAIPFWGAVILLMLFIRIGCIILFFPEIQHWNRAWIDHTEQHSGGPYSSLCAIGQHSCTCYTDTKCVDGCWKQIGSADIRLITSHLSCKHKQFSTSISEERQQKCVFFLSKTRIKISFFKMKKYFNSFRIVRDSWRIGK